MRRSDIAARFDEIVAFAEVERFLDTAVKHYSDGMYLRLAFAVAAHLEPEILLVDEVLAVGDARFQRKCLGKMTDIAEREGRTVAVVSHNMGIIQRLCQRSLLMEGGRLVDDRADGRDHRRAISRNDVPAVAPGQVIDVSAAPRRGTGEARFLSVRYTSGNADAGYQPYPDGPLEFTMELETDERRAVPSFGVVFADRNGTKLVNADILATGVELELEPGRNTVVLTIDQLHLNPGVYDVALWIGDTVGVGYDLVEPAFQVDVVAQETAGLRRDAGIGVRQRDVPGTGRAPVSRLGRARAVARAIVPRTVQRRLRPTRCPRRGVSISEISGGPSRSVDTSGSSAASRSTGSISSASWRPTPRTSAATCSRSATRRTPASSAATA